jgi:hypothetical protein
VYNTKIREFYDAHSERCILAPIEALVGQFESFGQCVTQKLSPSIRLDPASFERMYHSQDLRPSRFSREVVQILATVSSEPLKLIDQLNERADLRAVTGEFGEAESPELPALAEFVTALSRPLSPAMKQSLLQLLVTLLAPAAAELMLGKVHEHAQSAQRRLDQLWLYAQHLERRCGEQEEQLGSELLGVKVHDQLQEQHRVLSSQADRIESLLVELEQVFDSRAWKVIRAYSSFKGKWHRKVS